MKFLSTLYRISVLPCDRFSVLSPVCIHISLPIPFTVLAPFFRMLCHRNLPPNQGGKLIIHTRARSSSPSFSYRRRLPCSLRCGA